MIAVPPIFYPSLPPPGFSTDPWHMPAVLSAPRQIYQKHPLNAATSWQSARATTVTDLQTPPPTSPGRIATCPAR